DLITEHRTKRIELHRCEPFEVRGRFLHLRVEITIDGDRAALQALEWCRTRYRRSGMRFCRGIGAFGLLDLEGAPRFAHLRSSTSGRGGRLGSAFSDAIDHDCPRPLIA